MIANYLSFKKVLYAFIGILALVSCASKEEVQERKQSAYDLSGSYNAVSNANSEVEMEFSITNEGSKNNVFITLVNRSALSKKESELLVKNKVDAKVIYDQFFLRDLDLGKGLTSIQRREGGDNISTDFGNSTEFNVCSSDYQYSKEITVSYCMSGTTSKSSTNVTGSLTLNISTTKITQQPNQEPQSSTTIDSVSLKFSTTGSFVYYKQNFGTWKQEYLWAENDAVSNLLQTIQLTGESTREIKQVAINLSYFSANKYFTYDGVKYVFNRELNLVSMEEFLKFNPAVLNYVLVPEDQRMTKKLYFTGQIWSLGNFSGELALMDNSGDVKTLGIVRYVKR